MSVECTCGSINQPWPELTLPIPAGASEKVAQELVSVLAEVNGVRGVQVNTSERQITVSFDSTYVTEPILQEIIEKTLTR